MVERCTCQKRSPSSCATSSVIGVRIRYSACAVQTQVANADTPTPKPTPKPETPHAKALGLLEKAKAEKEVNQKIVFLTAAVNADPRSEDIVYAAFFEAFKNHEIPYAKKWADEYLHDFPGGPSGHLNMVKGFIDTMPK